MRRERQPAPVRRRVAGAATLMVMLGAAVLAAGCGGGDNSATALSADQVAAFGSPYCGTAREWAVHELEGSADGAYARGGPAALKKWWSEQLAYLKTSLEQAPPELHKAEATVERVYRTRLTPLFEKYGFDFKRIEAEGTGVLLYMRQEGRGIGLAYGVQVVLVVQRRKGGRQRRQVHVEGFAHALHHRDQLRMRGKEADAQSSQGIGF